MDLPANMLLVSRSTIRSRAWGALRKAGVQLTAQQGGPGRAFVASGDIMSAQKVILGEAPRLSSPDPPRPTPRRPRGNSRPPSSPVEDVSEEIGARLVPVLTSMGDGLVTALEKWDGLSEGTQTFVLILAGVAKAPLGPVTTVVGTIMRAGTPCPICAAS